MLAIQVNSIKKFQFVIGLFCALSLAFNIITLILLLFLMNYLGAVQ